MRIKLNDSILYYHKTNNDFCKELSSLWPEYLRKILFFDNDNCRIYDDDLKKLFKNKLTELKSNYDKGKQQQNTYEYTNKDYVFIKFSIAEGISFPCRTATDVKKFKYIQDLEVLLTDFAENNDIQRIIFMTQIGIQ